MGYHPPNTTEDPATGEVVGMRELALRHDLPYAAIIKRYASGKRGHDLVKPISEAKRRSGEAFAERMKKARHGDRQSLAQHLAKDPIKAALMRPLVRSAC